MTGVVLVGVYVYMLESRPDLRVWHEARLDAEFRAADAASITTLDDYLRLEERLFAQLAERVYARIEDAERRMLNRYHAGSATDPTAQPQDWNRTFELEADHPVAGALLLHGLSDSPYSLRALGEQLNAQGMWVVGLRLPGHGTAPSGLLEVTWHDFAAAVRIAARRVRERIGPDAPLYIVGYSNGGALAVEYASARLAGETLPAVDALVLISPAIGVSPLAALAVWQARLAHLAGLEKLAWTDIRPEFDPYKYNSFTVNAGDQIYRLTLHTAARIEALAATGGVSGFPRVIAFQSVVDATIPPAALIDALLSKLAPEGHELVLFDVNRNTQAEPLLRRDPETLTSRLLDDATLPFGLTLVTNANPYTDRIVTRGRAAQTMALEETPLPLTWPTGVFSLSHVALPFAPDDPWYGDATPSAPGERRISLGNIAVRGERNLLEIADSYFLRLRYNPFFDYMAERVSGFLESHGAAPRND